MSQWRKWTFLFSVVVYVVLIVATSILGRRNSLSKEGPCPFPVGDDRGCLYNHNFVQTYSLLWTVCPVSHVASWPLISLIWRRSLRWPFTVDPLCGASTRAWNYPRQFELMAYYKIITTQHHVCQRSKTWHLNRCFVFTITVNITRPC